ncbi:DUF427 domain-containing protein [Arthrobacter bambusae]|uniref:DUF427 domain-containing protein n=1 Tax=Arthrobacter bambusae TaxID=1338426 RepID=UPI0027803B8E|nr:DUF427 domain-containing protein [Arthrobacter bambusae]MDQ0213098.1 uncharacterized protein (DUF427 family) [Arthrobacter bambusae]MDQ0237452.1 uncharacterized protein (DUF427 family) [Arthrobacter bambusae]
MAIRMQGEMRRLRERLRYEPTAKRIRAEAAGRSLVDSRRAVLVWEAGRVIPVFAVPDADIAAELVPADGVGPISGRVFRRHPGNGKEFTLRAPGIELPAAAFKPDDPDLSEYMLLDFDAFERWREDEQAIEGHPRDPFHRVDARAGSQRVRVESDGLVLAESTRPVFVYETMIPVRTYLPRTDVDLTLLERSERQSICPYKGRASYWSVRNGDARGRNVAWSYENTLPDAAQLKDLIAFYDERTDIHTEGEGRPGQAAQDPAVSG